MCRASQPYGNKHCARLATDAHPQTNAFSKLSYAVTITKQRPQREKPAREQVASQALPTRGRPPIPFANPYPLRTRSAPAECPGKPLPSPPHPAPVTTRTGYCSRSLLPPKATQKNDETWETVGAPGVHGTRGDQCLSHAELLDSSSTSEEAKSVLCLTRSQAGAMTGSPTGRHTAPLDSGRWRRWSQDKRLQKEVSGPFSFFFARADIR